ncbi:MAG: metallophosphoesterase family protein [Pseudomonadales bacterium]
MTRLLHLSDPHFGAERPEVVAALLGLHKKLQPDLVVLSGDLTQRAWPYQFKRAGAFLEALNPRARLLIPGNHDLPIINLLARVTRPYALYQQTFGGELEPVFESDSVLVIGVDTSTPSRRIDGEVTAAQVQRVCALLRSATAQQLRLVVVHQPVAVPAHSERQRLLHGAADAVPAWVAAGADAVLGGHIHLPFVLPLEVNYPQLQRRAWVIHAGTAVSDRLRMAQPNSVNELQFQPTPKPKLVVVRWDFGEQDASFAITDTHELVLDRARQQSSSGAL